MAKLNSNPSLAQTWLLIVDYGIATEMELQLVTDINGYSEDTLNDVIYARTGYRDLFQYMHAYEEGEL